MRNIHESKPEPTLMSELVDKGMKTLTIVYYLIQLVFLMFKKLVT